MKKEKKKRRKVKICPNWGSLSHHVSDDILKKFGLKLRRTDTEEKRKN